MRKNVALIGFMGSGKTSVGRALSKKLGLRFIETDEIVEKDAGKPIARIFSEDGERAFRRLEAEAVSRSSEAKGAIISCGGGVVTNPDNVAALKRNCIIVLLRASPEETLRRVGNGKSRPLLRAKDRLARIKALAKSRKNYYESAADILVDTDGINVGKVASLIAENLGNYDGNLD